jgi:hypothetical protein
MEESDHESGQQPPEIPSHETLSYSHKDIRISRTDVDWEMANPKAWEDLPPPEREALLREQGRRLYFALREISLRMDKFVPPEDGVKFSGAIDQILNSHKHPHFYEDPRVEPPEAPGES